MSDLALENLELYYSNIARELEEYQVDGVELTGVLRDGSRILYNYLADTVKYLPNDPDTMTEDEYRSEFAYRVKKMMMRAGINQTELARRTGIAQPSLSGYLSGRKTASYVNAAKIARALECSLDDFVFRG